MVQGGSSRVGNNDDEINRGLNKWFWCDWISLWPIVDLWPLQTANSRTGLLSGISVRKIVNILCSPFPSLSFSPYTPNWPLTPTIFPDTIPHPVSLSFFSSLIPFFLCITIHCVVGATASSRLLTDGNAWLGGRQQADSCVCRRLECTRWTGACAAISLSVSPLILYPPLSTPPPPPLLELIFSVCEYDPIYSTSMYLFLPPYTPPSSCQDESMCSCIRFRGLLYYWTILWAAKYLGRTETEPVASWEIIMNAVFANPYLTLGHNTKQYLDK